MEKYEVRQTLSQHLVLKSTAAALKASALPHIKHQHRAPRGKSIQTCRSFTSCHGLVLYVKLCWHKRGLHYLYAMHCPTPLCKYRAGLLDVSAPVCIHAFARSWPPAARLYMHFHFILSFWVCHKFTCRMPSTLPPLPMNPRAGVRVILRFWV